MKIRLEPEIYKNHKGTYTVLGVYGTIYLKRKKDVNNHFFALQNQANDYLKLLLQVSAELDFQLSSNILSTDNHSIIQITRSRTWFLERLKYLCFSTHVIALYKMNALYRMTVILQDISNYQSSKKHYNKLEDIKNQFFVNRSFYIVEKPILTIKQNQNETIAAKGKRLLSVS